ncbi:MAG: PDZ domain-containing protein [Gemmataceae bacterium]
MRITGSILLLAMLLGPVHGETPSSRQPTTIPFELLRSGHMAVQVKVNGMGPYLLIFDTGAPTSLVNSRVARDGKLLAGKPTSMFPGLGTIGEARIKNLEVGGQKVEDVACIVMDHPTVELIGQRLGKRIDGLVGFPFFARFKMTIDYEKKTMTLVPSGYKPQDVMNAMAMLLLSGPGKKTLIAGGQWGLVPAKETGDEADGVDIKAVVPGSAAEKAGLKRGDRLLILDGRWTDSVHDLYEAASHVEGGSTVTVRIKRNGKEQDIQVTPSRGL